LIKSRAGEGGSTHYREKISLTGGMKSERSEGKKECYS